MDEASAAFAERIFPATGINSGSSALPKDQLFKRMSRSEFVTYIRETTVSRRNSQIASVTYSAQLSRVFAIYTVCAFQVQQCAEHKSIQCSSALSWPAILSRCLRATAPGDHRQQVYTIPCSHLVSDAASSTACHAEHM
jgi:hypothetical protein